MKRSRMIKIGITIYVLITLGLQAVEQLYWLAQVNWIFNILDSEPMYFGYVVSQFNKFISQIVLLSFILLGNYEKIKIGSITLYPDNDEEVATKE